MFRLGSALGMAAVTATVAGAQMNPASVGQGMIMTSAINAQATQERRRRHHGDDEAMTDAEYCASIPKYRRTLGAQSDKVVRLTALCKQAGYSTGD